MASGPCPECGAPTVAGARFCHGCGRALLDDRPGGAEAAGGQRPAERLLWEGRPGAMLAPRLHLTDRYRLTDERLVIEHGLLGRWTEEIDLYRVTDVAVAQRLLARLVGHGDVRVLTTDRSAPEKRLFDVRGPDRVKDLIRGAARADRERRRVVLRNEV